MTDQWKWDVSAIQIETERLILRSLSAEDGEQLHEIFCDPEAADMAGFTVSRTRAHSEEKVQRLLARKDTLVLVEKRENRVIGFLSLRNRRLIYDAVPENKIGVEIGFVLNRHYWGQGLMPEVLRKMCRYCLEEWGCDYVYCRRFPRNTRCAQMLDRCGFTHLPDTAGECRGADREALSCHIRYREEK